MWACDAGWLNIIWLDAKRVRCGEGCRQYALCSKEGVAKAAREVMERCQQRCYRNPGAIIF